MILGPGLITGAADDDPSGISTYSVAGAAYGPGFQRSKNVVLVGGNQWPSRAASDPA